MKAQKMYSKRQIFEDEARKALSCCAAIAEDFEAAKSKPYAELGLDYWAWFDILADLEARFSKDVAACSDKFKIETIDAMVDALYRAPAPKSTYKS